MDMQTIAIIPQTVLQIVLSVISLLIVSISPVVRLALFHNVKINYLLTILYIFQIGIG
jgi:hypothetical protein